MSRVTNLNRYPKHYLETADLIEGGKNEVVMGPFPNKAAAANQRLDLYAFRSSLEAAGYVDDYPRFAATRMYVSAKAPWNLTLRHADAVQVKIRAK